MSKLTLKERRRLEFTGALLREAVLTFDREHNGRLWRAVNPSVMVVGRGDGRIEIEIPSADGATNEKVDRSAAWVAAACLHFCFANRIPVPRQATKRIEPIEGGLQLVIEMTISVVGTIDSSSDRTGTPPRSSIQEAAANEVPSSAVAEPAKA
ncbi:MAG: hypothetical protein U1E63_16165 [Burkholderiales bacterium]